MVWVFVGVSDVPLPCWLRQVFNKNSMGKDDLIGGARRDLPRAPGMPDSCWLPISRGNHKQAGQVRVSLTFQPMVGGPCHVATLGLSGPARVPKHAGKAIHRDTLCCCLVLAGRRSRPLWCPTAKPVARWSSRSVPNRRPQASPSRRHNRGPAHQHAACLAWTAQTCTKCSPCSAYFDPCPPTAQQPRSTHPVLWSLVSVRRLPTASRQCLPAPSRRLPTPSRRRLPTPRYGAPCRLQPCHAVR